jgi:hypothetical protein
MSDVIRLLKCSRHSSAFTEVPVRISPLIRRWPMPDADDSQYKGADHNIITTT